MNSKRNVSKYAQKTFSKGCPNKCSKIGSKVVFSNVLLRIFSKMYRKKKRFIMFLKRKLTKKTRKKTKSNVPKCVQNKPYSCAQKNFKICLKRKIFCCTMKKKTFQIVSKITFKKYPKEIFQIAPQTKPCKTCQKKCFKMYSK